MENKFYLKYSIKYGLDFDDINKLSSILFQMGLTDLDSSKAHKIANYICENHIVNNAPEQIIAELRQHGF